MCHRIFLLFFLLRATTNVSAQPAPAWFVQTTVFAARYHPEIEYQPAVGAGASIGHFIHQNWLAIAAGFEYTRATQQLQLAAGRAETHTDIYRSLLTFKAARPLKPRTLVWFGSLHSGWSSFQPQRLTIDVGVAGKMTLRPAGEIKFVAAWESGLTLHVINAAALLLAVRQNFSRFTSRQLGSDQAERRWRHEWNYATGLLYFF